MDIEWEERSFTRDLWECVQTLMLPIYNDVQIFTEDPLMWEEEYWRYNKLLKLKKGIEAAKTAYKTKKGMHQKVVVGDVGRNEIEG